MHQHFKKTRRLFMVLAISAPILFFAGFLAYTVWHLGWGGFFMLALTRRADPSQSESDHPPAWWRGNLTRRVDSSQSESLPIFTGKLFRAVLLDGVPTFLILLWLIHIPEFMAFFDKIISKDALCDWRVITAAAIWTLSGIFSGVKRIQGLTDKEIYQFIDGGNRLVPKTPRP